MTKLGVRISDIYGTAKFQIEVPEVTKENILKGIEDNYEKVVQQIDRIMGGPVVVCEPTLTEYYGKEVARGNILWWFLGGHRIELEMLKAA